MRDGVAEGFELLIGEGELAGALRDAVFEFGVRCGECGV